MNKLLKNVLLLLIGLVQTTVYAQTNDVRENAIDCIVEQTEEYICGRIEETVADRYDWISSPRVWWDVIISSNNTRKKNWTGHFEENGISKEGIQSFINEQVDAYNSEHIQKIKWACLSEINVVDDASFELIVKRERYELYCWLGTILLGALVGALVGAIIGYFIDIESEEDFPKFGIRFIQLVAFGIGIYMSMSFLAPVETSISNSITENIYQQLSNMNIFEQL